jgi:hypothetical protein
MHRWKFALALFLAGTSPAWCQLIDDFESYTDTSDLRTVWIFATLDSSTPNHAAGSQSLRLAGKSGSFFSSRPLDPPLDLAGETVALWVRRDPASVPSTRVEIALLDGSGHDCESRPFGFSDDAWHPLAMDVDADCPAIDTSHVVRMAVFVANGSGTAGFIGANFDDIEHHPFRDGFESGDLSAWSLSSP